MMFVSGLGYQLKFITFESSVIAKVMNLKFITKIDDKKVIKSKMNLLT